MRAIIKILEDLSQEEIISVNVPTGVPLVYDFNDNFNITSKKYLINDSDLKQKLQVVENQGKSQ